MVAPSQNADRRERTYLLKTSESSVYIFNAYMPTHDSDSISDYNKHLDLLHTLIVKYRSDGAVVFVAI